MNEAQNLLGKLASSLESYIPLVNSVLQQWGLMVMPPGTPTAVAVDNLGRFQYYLDTLYGGVLEEDKKDVRNSIIGLVESISPGFREQYERGQIPEDLRNQIEQLVNNATSIYGLLSVSSPELAQIVNPRSRVGLAMELSALFGQYPVAATPQETAAIASAITSKILSNPQYHKGFTSQEIAQLTRRAFMEGLVTGTTEEEITDQIVGVAHLVAPIRDFAAATGHEFSPDEGVRIVKLLQSRFPSLSYDELAANIWTWAKIGQAGGMYRIALTPGAAPVEMQEIIRRAGVPPDQLEAQSSQLMIRGARSLLGSVAGAVVRSVHTGLVRPGTPAYRMYLDIVNGRPMRIRTPMEAASVLTQSGIRPDVAAMLLTQRAQNQYYLTPGALLSIRLTQYQIDWAPRFAAVAQMFPATDPQSAEVQRGVMSEMVARAGYNNIEHFMALHAITPFADIWRTMSQAGANASAISGMHNLRTFRGIPYLMTRFQDAGRGEGGAVTVADFLRAIFNAVPAQEAAIPTWYLGTFELPANTQEVISRTAPSSSSRFPWIPEWKSVERLQPLAPRLETQQQPLKPAEPVQPAVQPASQPVEQPVNQPAPAQPGPMRGNPGAENTGQP